MLPKSYKENAETCGACTHMGRHLRSEHSRTIIDSFCTLMMVGDGPVTYANREKRRVDPVRGRCNFFKRREIV